MKNSGLNAKFNVKTYTAELLRELHMRETVWAKIPGTNKFRNSKHQQQYDVLNELYLVLMYCHTPAFQAMQEKALSAMQLVLQSNQMEFEDVSFTTTF